MTDDNMNAAFDQRIEDWIEGLMSSTDKQVFEAQLAIDEPLRARALARKDEVLALQQALAGMADGGPGSVQDFASARPGDVPVSGVDFAERLAQAAATTRQDEPEASVHAFPAPRRSFGWAPWAASIAAAVLLTGVTWWVWNLEPTRVETNSASAGSVPSKDDDALATMDNLRKQKELSDGVFTGSAPAITPRTLDELADGSDPGNVDFLRMDAKKAGEPNALDPAVDPVFDTARRIDRLRARIGKGEPLPFAEPEGKAAELSESELEELVVNHRGAPDLTPSQPTPNQPTPGAAPPGLVELRDAPGEKGVRQIQDPKGVPNEAPATGGKAIEDKVQIEDRPEVAQKRQAQVGQVERGEVAAERSAPVTVDRRFADSLVSLEMLRETASASGNYGYFVTNQLARNVLVLGEEKPMTALVIDLDPAAFAVGLKFRGTQVEDTPLGSRARRGKGVATELWNGLAEWSLQPLPIAPPGDLGAELTVTPLWPVEERSADPEDAEEAENADDGADAASQDLNVFFDGGRYAVRLDSMNAPVYKNAKASLSTLRALRVVGSKARVAQAASSLGQWVKETAGVNRLDAPMIQQVVVDALVDADVDGVRKDLPALNGWSALPEGQSDLLLVFRSFVPLAPVKPAKEAESTGGR